MSSLWSKPMLLLFTAPLLVLVVMFLSYQHHQPPSITQINVNNHYHLSTKLRSAIDNRLSTPDIPPDSEVDVPQPAIEPQPTQPTPVTPPAATTPTRYGPSRVEPHPHHALMSNVCYRESYWDTEKSQHVKAAMIFYGVSDAQKQADAAKYWSKLHPDWGIRVAYAPLTDTFPAPNTRLLRGNTFLYTLFNDNIAQFYQELVCHMPVLLNDQYRAQTGFSDHHWNNFYGPHIRYKQADNATTKPEWCQTQVKWLTEAIDARQPGLPPMELVDEAEQQQMVRKLSSQLLPVMCFENVTIYVPGSCGGLGGPYPRGTNDTYAHLRQYVFNKLGLARHHQCASKVVIYDRYDAPRRRLMNGPEIKAKFDEWLKARSHTAPVTVTHVSKLPKGIFNQAQWFNDADIVIQPHSASNYNALFMHDSAVHLEIGQHGTWFGEGMAPYITTGLEYKRFGFGWQLIQWDPKFDNQEFDGERSFHVKPELIRALWDHVQWRFCNTTQAA